MPSPRAGENVCMAQTVKIEWNSEVEGEKNQLVAVSQNLLKIGWQHPRMHTYVYRASVRLPSSGYSGSGVLKKRKNEKKKEETDERIRRKRVLLTN